VGRPNMRLKPGPYSRKHGRQQFVLIVGHADLPSPYYVTFRTLGIPGIGTIPLSCETAPLRPQAWSNK
jgi:hypothetical protein